VNFTYMYGSNVSTQLRLDVHLLSYQMNHTLRFYRRARACIAMSKAHAKYWVPPHKPSFFIVPFGPLMSAVATGRDDMKDTGAMRALRMPQIQS
jgi:hypothetical protein